MIQEACTAIPAVHVTFLVNDLACKPTWQQALKGLFVLICHTFLSQSLIQVQGVGHFKNAIRLAKAQLA